MSAVPSCSDLMTYEGGTLVSRQRESLRPVKGMKVAVVVESCKHLMRSCIGAMDGCPRIKYDYRKSVQNALYAR